MKKRQGSSKMQSVIIAILAILLVGIMTTGVTYAFFTDKDGASDKLTFGTIKLDKMLSTDSVVDFRGTDKEHRSEIMPGDTIFTEFDITLEENSEDAWVRFKLVASVSEATFAKVLGFESYVEKDLLHDTNGDVIPTVHLVYDNEEYVIANAETVQKYVDGEAEAVEAEEAAEVLAAAGRYVAEFTIDGAAYAVTFAERLGEGDGAGVVGVTTVVTKDGVALDTQIDLQKADHELALAAATRAIARIDAVEEAITLLNEYIAAEEVGGFHGTTQDDKRGDGWIYKAEKLTNKEGILAADGVNELSHTAAVEYEYTIPRKTTGNALQGVQVDFELFVQAVQWDNNTAAENVDVDISSIGVDGADNTANPAAECIKAFYVVEHEIEAAP